MGLTSEPTAKAQLKAVQLAYTHLREQCVDTEYVNRQVRHETDVSRAFREFERELKAMGSPIVPLV